MSANNDDDRSKVVDQHFWFTATAMGLNGFLISSSDKIDYSLFTVFWISFINLYICFLIIHRSAYHAGKIKLPQKIKNIPQSERGFKEKIQETGIHFKISFKHILFVIGEFSGSLLYLLLVLTSFVAFLSICIF